MSYELFSPPSYMNIYIYTHKKNLTLNGTKYQGGNIQLQHSNLQTNLFCFVFLYPKIYIVWLRMMIAYVKFLNRKDVL